MMRCISAETLKARRTIHLLGVIAMPTVLAVLNLALMITTSRENGYATPGGWLSFAHNTISFGSMLVLPFDVVVLVALLVAHWLTPPFIPLLMTANIMHETSLGDVAQSIVAPLTVILPITGGYLWLVPYLSKWQRGRQAVAS